MPSPPKSSKRSESLQSLYNPNHRRGYCGRWYQEVCFVIIAAFLILSGGGLTFVAAFFHIRDLYVLGPAFLIIGLIMLIVGAILLTKKAKQLAKVAAARREEEGNAFSSIQPKSEKRFLPSFMNGYPSPNAGKIQKKPAQDDLYGGKDNQKSKQNAIMLTDMNNYPFDALNADFCPNVSFPRSSYNNLKTVAAQDSTHGDATYYTPLSRFKDSPKKAADATSDILPKLESRTAEPNKIESDSVSERRDSSCRVEIHTNVPPAASYTPVSLTKVELSDPDHHTSGIT